MEWSLRSILGSLQLPVAGFGLALLAFAVWSGYTLPPSPPQSDGFVEGMALMVLLILGIVGFIVLVGGLLIPPGPGVGIHFARKQRWLFAYALVSPVVGMMAFAVVLNTAYLVSGPSEIALYVFLVALGSAPLALVVGLGWKAVQVVAART